MSPDPKRSASLSWEPLGSIAEVLEPEREAPALDTLLVPTLSQDQGWAAVGRRRFHLSDLPDLRRLIVPLALAALVALLLGLGFGFSYGDLSAMPLPSRVTLAAASPRALARAGQKLAAGAPHGVRIEVDTIANRLFLKQGDKILREAVCSTGTGGLLVDPHSGRRWVFETPHGVHRVLDKKKDPIWNKPDWAFVEEGTPIPKTEAERLDPYSLGDYALYLGGGYLIHGTLYQRLLGRSVTHGCIRLGDEDLAAIFKATPVGARVYIY